MIIFSLSVHGYKLLAIPWDIFLAIVPCILAYGMTVAIGRRKWKQLKNLEKAVFVVLFLFWLFMFPNTAYLFMIPRHLVNYCADWDKYRVCPAEMWKVILFTTYALIGLPAFYYALNRMSVLFAKIDKKLLGKLVPILVIPLTSIGLMFGLLERFNSWDVIFRPLDLIRIALGYFTDKTMVFQLLLFTACLYFIYYAFDYFLRKFLN